MLTPARQTKLDRNQYAGFEAFRDDIFLMCDNATVYNKSKSQVHSDALRLRKLVESYDVDVSVPAPLEEEATPARPMRNAKGGGGPGTMQQAMLKILDDMLAYTNERYPSPLPSRSFGF